MHLYITVNEIHLHWIINKRFNNFKIHHQLRENQSIKLGLESHIPIEIKTKPQQMSKLSKSLSFHSRKNAIK